MGLVYGELGLEVADATERTTYQDQAVVMLKKSVDHHEDAMTLYQLALALSEAKEVFPKINQVEEAFNTLNRAIELNPQNPMFYNLLALLLSAKAQHETASKVALTGWSSCVSHQIKARNGQLDSSNEKSLLWDNIDPGFKEELLKFQILTKFTTYLCCSGNED